MVPDCFPVCLLQDLEDDGASSDAGDDDEDDDMEEETGDESYSLPPTSEAADSLQGEEDVADESEEAEPRSLAADFEVAAAVLEILGMDVDAEEEQTMACEEAESLELPGKEAESLELPGKEAESLEVPGKEAESLEVPDKEVENGGEDLGNIQTASNDVVLIEDAQDMLAGASTEPTVAEQPEATSAPLQKGHVFIDLEGEDAKCVSCGLPEHSCYCSRMKQLKAMLQASKNRLLARSLGHFL